jgi:hypothetical protein
MESSAGKIAFAAISLALAFAALGLAYRGNVGHQSFKAFYCAGEAVRERQDPYRVEPLRSCERRVAPSDKPDGYVEPAPLPGYALAVFGLAAVPYRLAAALFALLLAIAAIASAHYLAAILAAPRAAVLLVFAPLTLLNVAYGEIAPLALLGICSAAYFLANGRGALAGFAVALAMVQPNVGVTAAAAIFLFVPAARVAIGLSAISLSILSFVALGPNENLEYLTRALPQMANAELVASDQYNLSHLLYAAGFSASVSLLWGKIWFFVLACAGILLARTTAFQQRQPEMLALLPPAIVLFFGIYLHDIQMLLALPGALAVATRVRIGAIRGLAAVGVALLTAVWTQRVGRSAVLLDFLGAASGLYLVLTGSARRRVTLGLAGAAAIIACLVLLQHVEPPLTRSQIVTRDFHSRPGDPASIAWTTYLRSTPALTRPIFVLKIPTWVGLSLLIVGAFGLCYSRPILSGSHELPLATGLYNVSLQKYD